MADEHAPLSAAEVEAIRVRCEAATPDPWNVEGGPQIALVVKYLPPGYGRINHIGTVGPTTIGCDVPSDAEFIAAARTDVPRLLATLDAYREIVAAVARAHPIPRGRAGDTVEAWVCHFCDADARLTTSHAADCPVTVARALLAQE